MIFVKISQNFYRISLKILVHLTDFSPQFMACMKDRFSRLEAQTPKDKFSHVEACIIVIYINYKYLKI